MKYKHTRTGITHHDLAQDRAFWRDAPACAVCRRIAREVTGTVGSRSSATPHGSHCAGRRSRFPQVGVFLRRAGLAGEAFFALADRARLVIEPLLRAELGPDLAIEWGASHHPGMTDIAAILAAPLPRSDGAAQQDASGRRRVVELFRVPGGRSGGEQYLPRAAERHPRGLGERGG
jgi:hypothetical protein